MDDYYRLARCGIVMWKEGRVKRFIVGKEAKVEGSFDEKAFFQEAVEE